MFDIGFTELLVIAVVGLLVIGPEQLPGTVRTGMLWLGRLRRSFTQVRTELEREIGAEDIRRQLHNESVMQSIEKTRDEVNSIANQAQAEIKNVEDSLNEEFDPYPQTDEAQNSGSAITDTTAVDTDSSPKSDQ